MIQGSGLPAYLHSRQNAWFTPRTEGEVWHKSPHMHRLPRGNTGWRPGRV